MQKKLALACALVPQPDVLLLDEPTTGVDPVSRREFWDSLAQLATEGLTILVATPYLDEAERCTRVAFMHLGEVKELDTPSGLRNSLHAERLEVYFDDVRAVGTAARALESIPGIVDVQRFGDRLDVLAGQEQMDRVQRDVPETLDRAKIAVTSMRIDEPTLENVFVASIRASSPAQNIDAVSTDATFPGSRQRRRRRRFLTDAPLRQLHGRRSRQSRRAFRRSLRAARRERSRQDHDHQDALRPARADFRHDDACRRTRQHSLGRRSQPGRLHVAEVLAVRRSDDSREPRVFCRRLRRAERRAR